MSTETGEDTDFVILMSGDPQGAIKMRRHDPEAHYRYDRQCDCLYGACRLMRPHLIVATQLSHGSRAGAQTAPGGIDTYVSIGGTEDPASYKSRMYSRKARRESRGVNSC